MSEQTSQSSFNPHEHLMKIGRGENAKDYLPVQDRLRWFREECKEKGTIETEIIHLDLDKETIEEVMVWDKETRSYVKDIKKAPGLAIVRAVVRNGKGGVATGTKMEKAASFSDFLEKAETGAIGRALAALGYGTQFVDDLDEQHRIVDAPVDRASSAHTDERPNARGQSTPAASAQGRSQASTSTNSISAAKVQINKLSNDALLGRMKRMAADSGMGTGDWRKFVEEALGQFREDSDLLQDRRSLIALYRELEKRLTPASQEAMSVA
jgi:hypothetical protein